MKQITLPKKRWIRRVNHPGIFLTYDDGPNPLVTPQLLDLLQEIGGSATFFVTGESLDHPAASAILRRMLAAGHTIGNHGELHFKNTYSDFEVSQHRIEAACGIHTRIFRAPHGLKKHVAEYLRRDRSVLGVHWTHYLEDWLPVELDKVAQRIPEIVSPGAVILLHDGSPSADPYRDRSQVLEITKMIARECRRKSVPILGLASAYPALHRIRSESERALEGHRTNRGSSMADSISATLGIFKQWYGSH